jgi:zinc protease
MKPHITAIILLLCLSVQSYGQNYDPQQSLPFDSAYTKGVLPNGIKYLIRPLEKGKNVAYLCAFYNFGSFQEEPNEYGITHMLEHLCFAGKKQYLHLIGSNALDFGKDINASTGFESVTFKLFNLPLEKKGIVNSSLLCLKELAIDFHIKKEQLDKERKVVMQEWRLHNSLESETAKYNSVDFFSGDMGYLKYGTLGDTAVLSRLTVTDLERFHNKWFRPENLTIIAFGDFDTAVIKDKITQVFSKIPKSKEVNAIPKHIIRDCPEPVILISTDSEVAESKVEIHYKHERSSIYNQAALRIDFIDRLIERIFSDRLDKMRNNANSACSKVNAIYNSFYFGTSLYHEYLFNITSAGDVKSGLRNVLIENERVKKYGFSTAELKNAKEYIGKQFTKKENPFELPYNEHLTECRMYLIQGKIPLSSNYLCDFAARVLPAIQLEEVNNRFRQYTTNIQPVVSIIHAQKGGFGCPTIDEVREILKSVPLQKIDSFRNDTSEKMLFDKKVLSGNVIKETRNEKLATTEWTLSNGLRVIVNPTDFNASEVQFCGLRNKSIINFKDEYWSTWIYGGFTLDKMGVSTYNNSELKNKFAGKRISVKPLCNKDQGFQGSSAPEDLESALQLVNLYFSNPRWDEKVLEHEINGYKQYNNSLSASAIFNDSVIKNTYRSSPKTSILSDLNLVSLEKLQMIYKTIFSDPAQYTFIFSGNLKPEQIKPLVEKYLGSIDVTATTKKNDILKEIPDTVSTTKKNTLGLGRRSVKFNLHNSKSSAYVFLSCLGKYDSLLYNSVHEKLAQEILTKQCGNIIRGKFGNTYNVSAYNYRTISTGNCQFTIYFQTDPNNVEKMKEEAMAEMKLFMQGKIDEKEFNIQKTRILQSRSKDLKSNYWLVNTGLRKYYFHNKEIIPSYLDEVNKISLDDLKKYCKSIYSQGNIVDVQMETINDK